ncbi:MAG: ferritin-like protein Saci_2348 [Metallosphaera javensis (ex Sakai et al. 2022)]|nr:MAG: ferritin-like protein Saci_2348 [Metallosphaera javensis (ex Sakai et al. 2022)]
MKMSRPETKWTCDICKNKIYWDELFTFTGKKTVVHYTCFRDKASKTAKIEPAQLEIVLDMLEDELRDITIYKQKINVIKEEEIKKVLEQAEKDAEKNSALLTRVVEKFSGVSE